MKQAVTNIAKARSPIKFILLLLSVTACFIVAGLFVITPSLKRDGLLRGGPSLHARLKRIRVPNYPTATYTPPTKTPSTPPSTTHSRTKTLEMVVSGELLLTSFKRVKGTLIGSFCAVDWQARKKDPALFSFYGDLAKASGCKVKGSTFSVNLKDAVDACRAYDQAHARLPLEPAGFVLHESRCGSTLAANVLEVVSNSTRVYAEAPHLPSALKQRAYVDKLSSSTDKGKEEADATSFGSTPDPDQTEVRCRHEGTSQTPPPISYPECESARDSLFALLRRFACCSCSEMYTTLHLAVPLVPRKLFISSQRWRIGISTLFSTRSRRRLGFISCGTRSK